MIRRRLPVGNLHDILPGTTVSFRFGVSNGIAYNDGGTIKAYVNRCTHMGGTVALVPGSCLMRCVRHFAEFDPRTGARLSGEAPEGTALTPITLEILESGEIFAILEIKDEFE